MLDTTKNEIVFQLPNGESKGVEATDIWWLKELLVEGLRFRDPNISTLSKDEYSRLPENIRSILQMWMEAEGISTNIFVVAGSQDLNTIRIAPLTDSPIICSWPNDL
jgi:hypothetical protein